MKTSLTRQQAWFGRELARLVRKYHRTGGLTATEMGAILLGEGLELIEMGEGREVQIAILEHVLAERRKPETGNPLSGNPNRKPR